MFAVAEEQDIKTSLRKKDCLYPSETLQVFDNQRILLMYVYLLLNNQTPENKSLRSYFLSHSNKKVSLDLYPQSDT